MQHIDTCRDKSALITFLYGEASPSDQARIEAHLDVCSACRAEIESLGRARRDLATWVPDTPSEVGRVPIGGSRLTAVGWLGLAAAALLVLAGGAAVANLEVRYDARGFVVRTGWATAISDAAGEAAAAAPTRARPVGLTASPGDGTAGAGVEAELIGQVRELIRESEARQQRELALRLADLVRDLDSQRQADLTRIEQGIGWLEGMTEAEVVQQRELLDYLVWVSGR